MYNPRHLFSVARQGLDDMVPALRRAFNRRRDDDRLDRVFGPAPTIAIGALIIGGLAIGRILESLIDGGLLARHIDFPTAVLALAFAALFRRYLFGSGEARRHDFPWLAASLIPAALMLVGLAFLSRLFSGDIETIAGAPGWTAIGGVLDALADSIGLAAGLTIAVAALCFSRNWIKALRDLAVQLLMFRLLVFVTVLVFVEIGVVGPVLAFVLEGVLNLRLPSWLGEFADQLTYAALITTIYLAIIGATWTVCRNSFGRLIESGEAEILGEIRAMGEPAEKRVRRAAQAANAARPDHTGDGPAPRGPE